MDFGLTIAPIAIIVFATALKDAIEDYRRFKTDASVNASQTYVLRNSIISEEQEHEQEKEAIPTILLNIFIVNTCRYFTLNNSFNHSITLI